MRLRDDVAQIVEEASAPALHRDRYCVFHLISRLVNFVNKPWDAREFGPHYNKPDAIHMRWLQEVQQYRL